jgi:sterol desaturase/sphingolipid hydroxylase (fatty acid hydroxylase superfamily)
VDWLAAHRWYDGTGLGVAGGALVGFVLIELAVYAWHRSAHAFSPLWRLFHQVHHGPTRVDIPGALLFHPLETAVYTIISLFLTVVVLGLDPFAAAIAGYVFSFYALFQHWNIRTPRWLGFFIQRPESHCEHHRMGVHYYNFSDLPLWDMVFGTFRNPRTFDGRCGFEGGHDRLLTAMLAFKDVNRSAYGRRSKGVIPRHGGTDAQLWTSLADRRGPQAGNSSTSGERGRPEGGQGRAPTPS